MMMIIMTMIILILLLLMMMMMMMMMLMMMLMMLMMMMMMMMMIEIMIMMMLMMLMMILNIDDYYFIQNFRKLKLNWHFSETAQSVCVQHLRYLWKYARAVAASSLVAMLCKGNNYSNSSRHNICKIIANKNLLMGIFPSLAGLVRMGLYSNGSIASISRKSIDDPSQGKLF